MAARRCKGKITTVHCPKNNLNPRTKAKIVMAAAGASVK